MGTSTYRVLIWNGAKVEELHGGPDRDTAKKYFRATPHPAALTHGADVLEHNARGKRHETAFARFASTADAPVKGAAKKAKPLPQQTPTEPMPEPVRFSMSIESLTVSVEHEDRVDEPRTTVRSMADVEAIVARDDAQAEARERGAAVEHDVTHAIDSSSGAVVTGSPDHDALTRAAAPSVDDTLCTNCHNEPRAKVSRRTRPEWSTWGAQCRARGLHTKQIAPAIVAEPTPVPVAEPTPVPVAEPTPEPTRAPAPSPAPTQTQPRSERPLCSNCNAEPRAGTHPNTRPEEVEWGARCRKRASTQRTPNRGRSAAAGQVVRVRCPADTDPTRRADHLAVDVRLPLTLSALGPLSERFSRCACGASLVVRLTSEVA